MVDISIDDSISFVGEADKLITLLCGGATETKKFSINLGLESVAVALAKQSVCLYNSRGLT
jgi:hypothetical protein